MTDRSVVIIVVQGQNMRLWKSRILTSVSSYSYCHLRIATISMTSHMFHLFICICKKLCLYFQWPSFKTLGYVYDINNPILFRISHEPLSVFTIAYSVISSPIEYFYFLSVGHSSGPVGLESSERIGKWRA